MKALRFTFSISVLGIMGLTGIGAVRAQDKPANQATEILQRETIRRQELLLQASQQLQEAENLIAAGKIEGVRAKIAGILASLPDAEEGREVHQRAAKILSALDATQASYLFDKKDYFGAREAARRSLENNPKNAVAQGILDQTAEKLGIAPGQDKPANPAVDPKFITRLNQVEENLKKARDYAAVGDFNAAEKAYQQALAIDPYNRVAAAGLKKVYVKMNVDAEVAHRSSNQERQTEVREAWTQRFQVDKELGAGQTIETQPVKKSSGYDLEQRMRSLILKQVDFTDASIEDAVKFLTEQSRQVDPEGRGINFLIKSEDVKQQAKTFSLKLSNVPVGEALRYITSLTGLRYRAEEFAVFIVPLSARDDVLVTREFPVRATFFEVEAGAASDSGDSGSARRRVRTVVEDEGSSGASGDAVRKSLEARGVQFTEGSTAIYNASTGTLTVRNTQDQIDLIEELVTENQGETLLVSVQAKFIEINQTDLDSLAFNYNLAGSYNYANIPGPNVVAGGAVGVTTHLNEAGSLVNSDAINNIINLTPDKGSAANPAAITSTPNRFGITGSLDGNAFQMLLDAISQKSSTDLVTAPSILVNDNAKGTITVAREFYYPTEFQAAKVSSNTIIAGNNATYAAAPTVIPTWPSQFQSRNVGVTLTVQPRVTVDRQRIYLVIKPEVVEFDGYINYGSIIYSSRDAAGNAYVSNGVQVSVPVNNNVINQPVFSTRTIENAQAEIQDGYTMVLGGLIREDVSTVEDKVPFLGDMPLVGRLFRSKTEQAVKRNLLIFVTVHILRPDGEPFNVATVPVPAAH